MNQADKSETLKVSLLGAELGADEIQVLADQMGVMTLHDGETLLVEGDEHRTLLLLAAGAIQVVKVVGDTEETIYQLRVGECAGTRAFVDGSPRKAGLRSVGDSQVLTLEPDAFESLVETHPWLVYKVMRALFRITHANLVRVNSETSELRNYLLKTGGRY
ncbi:Crp/Fnr family transcriptional regulator [uncultured Thiodictyon sp.]|jgi:CRP-like cAMP-binding protein|uniref:Crp/Fnr family transcriptional regulator n=1 Tax=uncultured Thiodictyon sp. TaxID=1846217 RepID=UPI0025DC2AB1|nr:cyclic nucleotide-binding domain-containing protein [uncultured Thiodictyon sp.]